MAHATIHLNQITVVNKRDEIGKDDAYLWVIGLQIVVPSSNVAGLEFIHAKSPLPGNLGGGFKRGESRAIPASVGNIEYDVVYPGLNVFGVAVFAWDHDKTPAATIQSAYSQCIATIDAEIRKLIDDILADGVDKTTGKLREVTAADQNVIQAAAKDVVKKVLLGSLGIVPWTLNFDDFVGAESLVERVTGSAPFSKAFTFELRKHANIGAHYRVTGTLSFKP
jgi:hypothetical protein